jgi:hypothetical protein
MVALCFTVLAGLGAAALFTRLRPPSLRYPSFALLLAGLLLELRNAPVELTLVPAGRSIPSVYRFIAEQPGHRPIAIVPSSWGQRLFTGPRGLAMHNYLAVSHGRRIFNGKSSWIPPSTHLFQRSTRQLPSGAAVRILQILRPEFFVVHGSDMDPRFARFLTDNLDQRTDILKRVYRDGDDSVYALLPSHDRSLGLLPTPSIDAQRFERIAQRHLKMSASRFSRHGSRALDGDPKTHWTTGRPQLVGDSVELTLDQPADVAAIDFTDYDMTFDAPAAFKIEVSEDGKTYRTVFERPRLRIYYDQVYHPKHFLFRVKLETPVRARRVRLTLLEAMPERYWTIYEAQLWTPKPAAGG